METASDNGLVAQMREAMRGEFAGMFAELQRFVDRRIAELSAELHGAVQLMDYSEANLSSQLTRVHEQVMGLIAAPAAATRNSGLELEAVVVATEQAANQIMESAEKIGDWLRSGERDPAAVETIATCVSAIFEACTFQDLTGQRIRRAIHNLQQIEAMLGGMIQPGDAAEASSPPATEPEPLRLPATIGADLAQDDIDSLLA